MLEEKLTLEMLDSLDEIQEIRDLLGVADAFRTWLPKAVDEPTTAPARDSLGNRGQIDWFIGIIKGSDSLCRYYTGEISFTTLEATFKWVDCCGAFSAMRVGSQDRAKLDGQSRKKTRGRPTILTPFEQFVFWICTFRRFKDDMLHICNLFGCGEDTGRNYYQLYCNAIHWFARFMMPEPTHEQYVRDTSAETRGLLGLNPNQGAVVGDCTERFINNTGSDALHAAFYSQYKSTTTLKICVRTTGGSYIAPAVVPYCGACSDNAIHTLLQVAKKLPRKADGDTQLVYNYDRGLTDTLSFMQEGIPVHTSDKKQTGQRVFSEGSADRSRNTAVSRIHVERNMAELRQYMAFGSKISLNQVSLAVCEAECARFLVNLKPALHNWVQVTQTAAEGGGAVIPEARTSSQDDYSRFYL
jgi:hypothetical protein